MSALLTFLLAVLPTAPAPESSTSDVPTSSGHAAGCKVGVYRSDGTRFVALTKTENGFRYMFSDGIGGRVGQGTDSITCRQGRVLVNGDDEWPRLETRQTETLFMSGSAQLAGRLIEPPFAGPSTPLVVFAHGSERSPWIDRASDPYQLVGRGVSVFVFDKRGTGASGGSYSQNFPELAEDLVAASRHAKQLALGRFGRFGLIGLSQGGWVAPIAASEVDADFIGIGYGLAVDMNQEDASQIAKALVDEGFGDADMEKARQLTDMTARVVRSDFRDGLDELEAFLAEHAHEKWLESIRGGHTGVLLSYPLDELRSDGVPAFDGLNVDWSHEPMQVLRGLSMPQLWVLAGEDREAPIAETLARLDRLKAEGKPICVFVFPDTDHGIREFEQAADGSRHYTRVAPGYFDLLADWSRGELSEQYGKSTRRKDMLGSDALPVAGPQRSQEGSVSHRALSTSSGGLRE